MSWATSGSICAVVEPILGCRKIEVALAVVQDYIICFALDRTAWREPQDACRRRIHRRALYDHPRTADDLVIIADEHHVYRGSAKAFSAAIRDLSPRALVDLTATPDTADFDKVIYRYSPAEAIADQLVKVPGIVHRQGGLKDQKTQLADAAGLRELKEPSWLAYAAHHGREPVHPVLFDVRREGQKYSANQTVGISGIAIEAQRDLEGTVSVITRGLDNVDATQNYVAASTVHGDLVNRILGLDLVAAQLTERVIAQDIAESQIKNAANWRDLIA